MKCLCDEMKLGERCRHCDNVRLPWTSKDMWEGASPALRPQLITGNWEHGEPNLQVRGNYCNSSPSTMGSQEIISQTGNSGSGNISMIFKDLEMNIKILKRVKMATPGEVNMGKRRQSAVFIWNLVGHFGSSLCNFNKKHNFLKVIWAHLSHVSSNDEFIFLFSTLAISWGPLKLKSPSLSFPKKFFILLCLLLKPLKLLHKPGGVS